MRHFWYSRQMHEVLAEQYPPGKVQLLPDGSGRVSTLNTDSADDHGTLWPDIVYLGSFDGPIVPIDAYATWKKE